LEKSIIKKLNVVEDREQHQLEISNRFSALENLGEKNNINRDSESISISKSQLRQSRATNQPTTRSTAFLENVIKA
jgi:hypothetical protein